MDSESRSRVILDVQAGREVVRATPMSEKPFHILLLGDFGGGGSPASRPVEVDRDNLDDVLSALQPTVRLPLGPEASADVEIAFRSLDDFHPDALLRRVPLLRGLLELRQQAQQGRLPGAPPTSGPAEPSAAVTAPPAGGSVLDMILAEAPASVSAATPPSPDDLHAWLRATVAPHLSPPDDPSQAAVVARIDETAALALRVVLHHPAFQAMEAAWRAVSLLVRRLETDNQLKVFLLDATRDDLARALNRGAPDALFGSSGAGWAVLVGLYTFDGSDDDAALLARIAAAARQAGAPFIAAAAPGLAGVDSFAAAPEAADLAFAAAPRWDALRRSPDAALVGLVAPRFLLRAPYDPREEPCEELAFDELGTAPRHEEYLWGPPAVAAALLLGEAFAASRWQMRAGDVLEIGGLPLHVLRAADGSEAKPCAETLLTDRVAIRLLDAGLMPLLSRKNQDAVRLAAFQSIAEPAAPLAGPWREG